nr:ATP-binding protein [Desulfofundulus thermobenzoicus]
MSSHYFAIGKEGYQVLFEVEALETCLLDMETGVRGYLLTGEKDFLEPYNGGKKEIDRHFSTLFSLFPPGSPAARKLEEVKNDAYLWLDRVGDPGVLRREEVDGRLSPAQLSTREREGKKLMDRLRGEIDQLVEIVQADRQSRLASIYDLHRRVSRQIYYSTGLAVVVMAMLGGFLYQRLEIIEENNRLLAEQKERLNHLVAELETASRLKSEFLANMSHELRTPLNAVIGFAQVLQKQFYGPLTEKQKTYVEYILTSGRHLLDLINDILDLSKIEAGKMELDLTTLSLPEIFQNSLLMVREKAKKHGIELSWSVAEDVPEITADERKLRQVIYNLLANAVKFTPAGGRVALDAHLAAGSGEEERERYVVISVSDTGIGIPASEQERIFQPFVQAEGGYSRRHEGTGLGLALVKRLVELHGGRVWVQSAGVGKGSTFFVRLPVKQGETEG